MASKLKLMFRALALFSFVLVANAQRLLASPPPATYRTAGIVVDSVTGQPLEGAEVTIAPVTALDDAQTFLTSSDGRFLFVGLARGKYRLMAGRRGYALQGFQQHEAFMTGIAVGPGLDSEHIRFPLVPGSVITGVVTDDWGDPVRDAKVLLFQQNTFDGSRAVRNINQATTDDQGRYRFAHLLSGTYAVAVYARPWYAQSQMQVEAMEGNINLVDANVIVDRTAQSLIVGGEAPLAPSSPSPDPLFDFVYPLTFFPNATSLAEATRFALAPGATQAADLQLRAVPSVHLRVRVPEQPSVPVTIATQQEDGQQTTHEGQPPSDVAQVDASPDVSLALKIGNYYTEPIEPTRKEIAPGILEFSGIPPGIELNLITGSVLGDKDGSVVSHDKTFDVSGDADVDLSPQGDFANVSGVVLSSKFSFPPASAPQTSPDQTSPDEAALIQAVEGASSNEMITFRSLKTGETYGASISSSGKFSFAGSALPSGSFEVEFSGQSQLHVSSLEASGATVSGRTIEIPAGKPVNVTVHAAEPNCALSGFALKSGKPVAGAMVLLVPQDPGHDMSLYHRDQSDSDGSFSMSPLFPGRYILLAIENGWDLEWADPKVMFQYLPGGLPLELKPGASFILNPQVQ